MALKIDIRETPDAVILDLHGPYPMSSSLMGLRVKLFRKCLWAWLAYQ